MTVIAWDGKTLAAEIASDLCATCGMVIDALEL